MRLLCNRGHFDRENKTHVIGEQNREVQIKFQTCVALKADWFKSRELNFFAFILQGGQFSLFALRRTSALFSHGKSNWWSIWSISAIGNADLLSGIFFLGSFFLSYLIFHQVIFNLGTWNYLFRQEVELKTVICFGRTKVIWSFVGSLSSLINITIFFFFKQIYMFNKYYSTVGFCWLESLFTRLRTSDTSPLGIISPLQVTTISCNSWNNSSNKLYFICYLQG